jgi:GTP-binding protein HflX
MNALSDADVRAENKLFATLDATTRAVALDNKTSILLTDTVGFIRKLPHALVESFKSTLDEVRESDALLHVVDLSHPRHEDMIAVVNTTLQELGAYDKPQILVFNKIDAVENAGILEATRGSFTDSVFVSALRGIGLKELTERVKGVVTDQTDEMVVTLCVTNSKGRARLHELADVVSEELLPAVGGDGLDGSTLRIVVRAPSSRQAAILRETGAVTASQDE